MGIHTGLQVGADRIGQGLERVAVDLVAPGEDQRRLHALGRQFPGPVGMQHDDADGADD